MEDDWIKIEPIVEKIIKRSAHKHVFLYFSKEDIAQEIRSIALEAYRSYDITKGVLENFLARSILNRINNLKRDNSYILQTPCISYKCYFYNKENRSCKWQKDKCIDWQQYSKVYNEKNTVANPISYSQDQNLIISKESQDLDIYMNDLLDLAKKKDNECYIALKNNIDSKKDIPDSLKNRVLQLISEVA